MSTENMGKITISLSNESEKALRQRAKRNLRSISKEIEFLVIEAERKDKVKWMETEVVCPYCKKRFIAEVVIKHNPYIDVPTVSEVGISKYKKLE